MSKLNNSKPSFSKRRLIENEVIFRDVNKNIKEFIDQETSGTRSTVLPFYCECSNPDCIERINLSTAEYEKLHKENKLFITMIGHEFPEIEKIIKKDKHYQVVEKHFSPPKPSDIDLALKSISIKQKSAIAGN